MHSILIATQYYFGDQPQGADRLAWDEAVHLARCGHAVTLTGFDSTGDKRPLEEIDGVRIVRYRLPQNPSLLRRASAHSEALRRRLTELPAGDRRWHVVHGHNVLVARGAFRACNAAKVYTAHSPILDEIRAEKRPGLAGALTCELRARLAHALERKVLSACAWVSADSRFGCELLRTRHPGEAAKVRWLRAWVHGDRFEVRDAREARRTLGWPSDGPVLFTLRRLVRRMGLDRLLEASGMLVREGLKFSLVIAGGGPLRAELERQSQSLGLSNTVRFIGRLSESDLPLAYAAADAFVLPTAALEGFGLIALEAFASGRPVLGTPVGAIPEIVGEFEPRWLANDTSAGAIAALLRAQLRGELPSHPANSLRAFALDSYDAKRAVPELCEAVTETARQTPRPD